MDETLFPLPPGNNPDEEVDLQGKPRLKRPNRAQIAFRPSSLEELVPEDHSVRLIWEWVEVLDLSPLYRDIRAVKDMLDRMRSIPKY